MKKLRCLFAVLSFLLCIHIIALADSVILPDTLDQYEIPPVISLCIDGVDLKGSYLIESDIGDYFVVKSIIDVGDQIEVKCYISPDYSADQNTLFTVRYGREGNCMNQERLSLEALQRGMRCGFSKNIINQYNIPSVISLHVS